MLSEKIKTLRLSRGINQTELAKNLGVTKQCVSNWENDNIQPSVEMLVKIAKFFNTSADFLLDLEDDRTISVRGLSERQAAHIALIIEDFKE